MNLNDLREKYGSPSLIERLKSRPWYQLAEKVILPLFTTSSSSNKEVLQIFIETFAAVKKCAESDVNNTVKAIVNKYESDVRKIIDDGDCCDGEKIAGKFKDILKKSLIKLWGIGNYSNVLHKYFEKNKIRLEYFEKGSKISDEQLEKLNGNEIEGYREETDDPKKKDEIIEMVRPVIYIDYKDEDGNDETEYIEGACRLFRLQK